MATIRISQTLDFDVEPTDAYEHEVTGVDFWITQGRARVFGTITPTQARAIAELLTNAADNAEAQAITDPTLPL